MNKFKVGDTVKYDGKVTTINSISKRDGKVIYLLNSVTPRMPGDCCHGEKLEIVCTQ